MFWFYFDLDLDLDSKIDFEHKLEFDLCYASGCDFEFDLVLSSILTAA